MNTFAFLVNFGNSIFYIYTLHFDYELTQKIKFLPIKGVYLSKLVWLTLVCFVSGVVIVVWEYLCIENVLF